METNVRIKLIKIDLPEHFRVTDCRFDLQCAVNIKERVENETHSSQLVQQGRTFFPEWKRCFDVCMSPDRVIQIIVMDGERPIADAMVRLQDVVDVCKDDEAAAIWIKLRTAGRLLAQVKLFKGNSRPETESIGSSGSSSGYSHGIARRRGAIRHEKQHQILGHAFVATFFRQPTFCSICSLFVWGINKQGYQCVYCNCAVHKKCHSKILTRCPGSAAQTTETKVSKYVHITLLHVHYLSRWLNYSISLIRLLFSDYSIRDI
ncbi:unnamed protein product [Soboliphyme baturini]|uniref:Phorbol-ester/DAG-type domain-containing protein n=1 Tax=Soboliphyme baturini TaxID=241478 RepID=A0A183J5D7_9BILA|nr:unnamed protein product [Soboliphyme baturini]